VPAAAHRPSARTRIGFLILGLLALGLAVIVASCAEPSAAAAAPEATGTATPSPTARPTPSRTPKPSATPEATARATATATPAPATPDDSTTAGELTVHYLDVGQGDATVLIGPDATILIDAGRHDRSDVVPQLRGLGVTEIDVVAITHGHADHIGQLDDVLAAFPVGEVWMSGTSHTTQTFSRSVAAIEASAATYEEPRAGDTTTVGSLTVEILHPTRLTGDAHSDSLSMRITFGAVTFLFTGDAEAHTEAEMHAARGAGRLTATVYQVGHHGSQTSTSPAFLAAVDPEVAVYSAGEGNQYGHPHAEVISRLTDAGAAIYGTATHGTVSITTDGRSYTVATGTTGTTGAPIPAPPPPAAPATLAPTPAPPAPPPATSSCQPGQVDINVAPVDQLVRIIHIGPERAQQILGLRPFSSVDAMTRIKGIAEARLADIKAEGLACAG
jgi:competence protein ComEC